MDNVSREKFPTQAENITELLRPRKWRFLDEIQGEDHDLALMPRPHHTLVAKSAPRAAKWTRACL